MAFQRLTAEGRNIVSYLTAGGALLRDKLFDMCLANTKECPFCSCPIQTIDHTVHFCQHLDLVRAREWQEGDPVCLSSIPPETFPEWLRLGIPRAMDQTITGTYWGEPVEEVKLRTQLDRKVVGVRDHGKVAKPQREPKEITERKGTTELNARQLVDA